MQRETSGEPGPVSASTVDAEAHFDESDVAAAAGGDEQAFQRLTDIHRRELHLHCYRMLGSFHDAEDGVQETMLRAWRHLATFQGRSTFRAWLYRIATNVCLTRGVRRQAERELPKLIAREVARHSNEPVITLSPYPDHLLNEIEAAWSDPAAIYDLHESVQLAFLAAIQLLPPRQRTVLILHDVLGWSLRDVADTLDSTVAGVNGALSRARTTLHEHRAIGRLQTGRMAPTNEVERALVQGYVDAWQAADTKKLAGLLRSDVVLTMPPLPLRYDGRDAVTDFYGRVPFATHDRFRLIATRANRQPALAVYRFDSTTNTYQGVGIWVLTIDEDAVAEITTFIDRQLLPAFGLPAEIGGN